MANEFRLPDIGEGLTEVEIVEWLVAVGSEVGLDAPLVEVETDKAAVEIPSPYAGTLLFQGASAGETLSVGEVLAVVGEPGEEWAPSPSPAPSVEFETPAPIVGTLPESPGREALPAVRRRADELGVDLAGLSGSGPGGRITMEDVEAAGSGAVRRERLSPTRRAIAAHLEKSWREIPHVTTFGSARAEALLSERSRLLEEAEGPVPLEALIVLRLVPLLKRFPQFNAAVVGTDVLFKEQYNVAVAVDAPDGLIAPVVKNADTMTVHELADEIIRLAKSAKSKQLSPEQVTGATFTVSNIGAVGGGFGTPIIPYGTSAIASFGRAAPEAVVVGGELAVATMMPISLSYDHRLIDGALGRQFMAAMVEALEK
jgi:pyruvate dehydrogenase E2 component (dihydrolipoamide acetyltransferase)